MSDSIIMIGYLNKLYLEERKARLTLTHNCFKKAASIKRCLVILSFGQHPYFVCVPILLWRGHVFFLDPS